MQRNIKDYIIISLKGMAMGAADAIPGVSGGTIAFISGIYEELITSIGNLNFSILKTLKKDGVLKAWKQLNGSFLLALLIGIIISFVSFMKLAKYLIEFYPIHIWAFFFGLVVASVIYIGKQITNWSYKTILIGLAGIFIAYYITTLPALANNDSNLFFLLAGAIAICAMILPGISGAFILVLLGAYKTLSDAVDSFDLNRIAVFAIGALIGLLSFSKLLKWLFKNYKNSTLALLTGFIIGSLNKIWPWKNTLEWRTNSEGIKVPLRQESLSPFNFPENNYIAIAIVLMIVGFFSIIILEKIGSTKSE